jgi:hypothetical protein
MSPTTTPRVLSQHDWDFSAVKPDELPTCFWYEYCRESRLKVFVLRMAEAMTAEIVTKGASCRKTGSESQIAMRGYLSAWFIKCFADLPGFPDSPWLDIDRTARREHLTAMIRLDQLEVETKTADWPRWRLEQEAQGRLCGWFAISPGLTRKQAAAQFAEQVCAQQPNFFSIKRGGRGKAADMLNQLGAFRLLCGRTHQQAVAHVKANKAYLYDEDDPESWIRARDEAKMRLEDLSKCADDLLGMVEKVFS